MLQQKTIRTLQHPRKILKKNKNLSTKDVSFVNITQEYPCHNVLLSDKISNIKDLLFNEKQTQTSREVFDSTFMNSISIEELRHTPVRILNNNNSTTVEFASPLSRVEGVIPRDKKLQEHKNSCIDNKSKNCATDKIITYNRGILLNNTPSQGIRNKKITLNRNPICENHSSVKDVEESASITPNWVSLVFYKNEFDRYDKNNNYYSEMDESNIQSPLQGTQRIHRDIDGYISCLAGESESSMIPINFPLPGILKTSRILNETFTRTVNNRFATRILINSKYGYDLRENLAMCLKFYIGPRKSTGNVNPFTTEKNDMCNYSISIKEINPNGKVHFRIKPSTFEKVKYGYADLGKAEEKYGSEFSFNPRMVNIIFKPGTKIIKNDVKSLLIEFKNENRARIISGLLLALKYCYEDKLINKSPFAALQWDYLRARLLRRKT